MFDLQDKLFLLVALLSLLCLTSAFSTRFVTEEMKEEENMGVEKEKKTQQMENRVNEKISDTQNIEIKVIPLVTDIFTQTEDFLNMSPLKLATVISAQYLLTSIQNIPIAGNSAHDVFNMFHSLTKDINKTTEIIKLTAEFVNISSAYILSSLDQFIKSGCDSMIVEKEMELLRDKFLKFITDHVQLAVKELNDKTRDMTGSDLLVSSARHIVGAFQEMTNEVLMLSTLQNEKYQNPPLKNISFSVDQVTNEKINTDNKINSETHHEIKNHQAMKEDKLEMNVEHSENNQTMADLRENQDTTLEVLPLEFDYQDNEMNEKHVEKGMLKAPQVTRLEHYPLTLLSGNGNQKEKYNQLNNNGFNQKHSFSVSTVDQPNAKSTETIKILKDDNKPTTNFLNVVEILTNEALSDKKTSYQQCDDHLEPACGIDININRFIIFLNDCKRKTHNRVHGTNYVWFSIDTCVGIMLKNPNQMTKLAWNDKLDP